MGEVLIADNRSTPTARKPSPRRRGRESSISGAWSRRRPDRRDQGRQGRYVVMGDADAATTSPTSTALRDGLEGWSGPLHGQPLPGRHRAWRDAATASLRWAIRCCRSWAGSISTPGGRLPLRPSRLTASSILALGLQSTGTEYASEMVVKASLNNLAITEAPTTLKKDGRSRPPHLRTWRDGWRHLRFLLIHSPNGCSPCLAGSCWGWACSGPFDDPGA